MPYCQSIERRQKTEPAMNGDLISRHFATYVRKNLTRPVRITGGIIIMFIHPFFTSCYFHALLAG